jgi:hypothetical protein
MHTTHSTLALFTSAAAIATIALACSAGTAGEDGVGASGPSSTGSFSSGGAGQGGGFSSTSGVGGFESCATAEDTALPQKVPADIIIAVDTSGSMSEEAAWVQDALNGFATTITSAGIDLRVVLIADTSVCIPAPLGSGQCAGADTNEPVYRHVNQVVASSDALERILGAYPQYADMLRPQATKTFLVVSDDESSMDAASFTSQLLALDPQFQGFQFDSIVASGGSFACGLGFGTCTSTNVCCYQDGPFCMSYGAEEGVTYKQLSQQTGGVIGDLCAQEFGPIFDDMAEGVIVSSQLSCEYSIPSPPEGEALNPAMVNVTYLPGGGGEAVQLYNVPGGLADCGAEGGWYYDDPLAPTRIYVCPSTCTTLQSDAEGEVKVVFGCDTIVVPQ